MTLYIDTLTLEELKEKRLLCSNKSITRPLEIGQLINKRDEIAVLTVTETSTRLESRIYIIMAVTESGFQDMLSCYGRLIREWQILKRANPDTYGHLGSISLVLSPNYHAYDHVGEHYIPLRMTIASDTPEVKENLLSLIHAFFST